MPPPDLAERTVLVTGGAGFIGSHLVDALLARGARVRVLDNFVTGRRENLAGALEAIELVEQDIRDPETCSRACAGVDVVFHQAALGSVPRSIEDPATTLEVNVVGSANIFRAASECRVRRVVFASSSSVYGDSGELPKVEGREGASLSPYALSKSVGEQLAALFGRCYGLRTVGLRYFNVFGPRQDPDGPYAAVVPRFFKACLAGEAPWIHGDGDQSRDFTYVADAVAANLLAATAPSTARGRAWNVAGGRPTTINRLAAMIAELTGASTPPVHGPERPGDVRHSHADLTGARTHLGYDPSWDVERGLRASLDGYRELFRPTGAG